MYNIYKITNNINNKVYIGCTTKSIEKRFKGHIHSYKNKHSLLYDDMKKYGIDNFRCELIEHGEDDSIRFDRERYYINKLNTMDTSIGYNMTIGGMGTIGYIFTDEAKNKISQGNIGKHHTEETKEHLRKVNKGKKLSQETKSKISEARKGKWCGEDNPFYGKSHTDEVKLKIRKSKESMGLTIPVRGINNGDSSIVEFRALTDAARFIQNIRGGKLSTILSHIGNSIKGINCKTAYGYKWEYMKESNDYPDRE